MSNFERRSEYVVKFYPQSGYCVASNDQNIDGWVFEPLNGSSAILLTEDQIEVDGQFEKIDNEIYFCYNCQGENNYLNVNGRTFVHYFSRLS